MRVRVLKKEMKMTKIVRISGHRACFTNPHHNVDKYSYDVPTVSAIRQVIGAVYAKPEIRHVIRRIEVLEPIKRETVLINGVTGLSGSTRGSPNPYLTSMLMDVDYRVFFDTQVLDGSNLRKHEEMFFRRLLRGAQYKQPYLGMRDMIAIVRPDYDDKPPIDVDMDLGKMLLDVVHPTKYHRTTNTVRTMAHLKMVKGVIDYSNIDVEVM